MEFVIGRNPAIECLRAKRRKVYKLLLLRGAKGLEAVVSAAAGIPIEEKSRQELDQLAPDAAHQGVILEAAPLPVHRVEDWIEREMPRDAIIVALDGVEDPHNFGAVARSAAACGALAILFGKDRAAPVSPSAVKASAGGMEHLDLVQATNLVRALDLLKEKGFWAAELDAAAPQLLWQADLTGRIVVVIGAEGAGVRRLVREHCDLHLRIPLPGRISSLNASVSAGIALAECLRQRQRG
jgi:23S rRNA (guanosine2251-2'-O)-methyltransferase